MTVALQDDKRQHCEVTTSSLLLVTARDDSERAFFETGCSLSFYNDLNPVKFLCMGICYASVYYASIYHIPSGTRPQTTQTFHVLKAMLNANT